jgi:hypothetical protein
MRFFVLSTLGLVYFKADELKKTTVDYEPQGYKPISDIVVQPVNAKDVSIMIINFYRSDEPFRLR